MQYRVDSQKSSSITDFSEFPAIRHTCALTIVSFIPTVPLSSQGSVVFCHSSRTSSEFAEPVHVHSVRYGNAILGSIGERNG